jgi:hypothetical protein
MTPEQLRALSIDCEKYPPKDSMRGRYDGRYCEDAIAAWGDSPLQMITVPRRTRFLVNRDTPRWLTKAP